MAGCPEMNGPIEIVSASLSGGDEVLTDEALLFLAGLEETFGARRRHLMDKRAERQRQIDDGQTPAFSKETVSIRTADWTVAKPPVDLVDRRVEITGPVNAKMIINALNSGANVFMADFEDSASPTWDVMVNGQRHLMEAVRRRLVLAASGGKQYELGTDLATLMVRPRGWHLTERHLRIDGEPLSASIVDFGLYFFHNAAELVKRGSGPYFYLPKLESHLEARLWNDVFTYSQAEMGLAHGTIRATVLIETILAALEMDEILYELRDHSAGLNAGRWDYIFSIIKKFRSHPDAVLPDRAQITMTVPFMSAYTDLLVKTCHRRGAHAMGGMAAFIPSRLDEEVNRIAMAKVAEDKEREAANGHDGTWVAHPDLIEVARDAFTARLGDRPNQIERLRDDVEASAAGLLDFTVEGGVITGAGVRTNVDVAIRYLAAWLCGNGAVAIYNLMEDAATAEISRSQLWQWVHHGVVTAEDRKVDEPFVREIAAEELARLASELGPEGFERGRFEAAWSLLEQLIFAHDFEDFLTIPAYELID